jgi:DNA-binding transcriptional regulator YbjK
MIKLVYFLEIMSKMYNDFLISFAKKKRNQMIVFVMVVVIEMKSNEIYKRLNQYFLLYLSLCVYVFKLFFSNTNLVID